MQYSTSLATIRIGDMSFERPFCYLPKSFTLFTESSTVSGSFLEQECKNFPALEFPSRSNHRPRQLLSLVGILTENLDYRDISKSSSNTEKPIRPAYTSSRGF